MPKIMISIPLTKYLKEITKGWSKLEKVFLTKTKGGLLYISDEAPGDIEGEDTDYTSPAWLGGETKHLDKNYIEFDDVGAYMKLPKDISQLIDMEPGTIKTLKEVLKDIKAKEATTCPQRD
jgi:hypothetical protein